MVMLIIAIALVSILVAVIMLMSALNLQMKYTERKAKRNFYTAEIAMEQIKAGLELEVSKAAQKAYESIQQTYATLTPEERAVNFKTVYALTLRKALMDGVETKYKLEKLQNFIDEKQFKIGGTDANTEMVSTKECKMDALSTGLVLYGVKITYTDDEGFQSIVETDFRLLIPELRFTEFSVMPDLFGYSLVAEGGLTGNNTGTVVVEDNVYVGGDGILVDGAAAKWQFKNMDRLVCKTTVAVKGSAQLSVQSNKEFNVSLWTKDILVDGAKATLNGRTYVADDLTLRGKKSQVTLEKEYYGYGNGTRLKTDGSFETDDKSSSAILINGLESTLNMKKLNNLILTGKAAVATGGTEVEKPEDGSEELEGIRIEDNENIPLGESIEIKSNQMAYLVPPECIGVFQGETLIGKNPMSAEDYRELLEYKADEAEYPGFEEVSYETTVQKLGKTLNDYDADGSLSYRKIFQQVGGEIVIYYYLLLDEQNITRYFSDYYEAEKEKLDGYMKQYTNELLINDNISRLVLGGNIVTYDGENITLRQNDTVLTQKEIKGLDEEINSYYRVFAALNSKLLTSYDELKEEEKTRTVFDNLVDKTKLPSTKNPIPLKIEDGNRTIEAYVTNGKFRFPEDVRNPENKKNVCLIVAEGGVTVSDDFSGLILSGGEVKIGAGKSVHLEGNREDLVKMLQAPTVTDDEDSPTILQEYFKEGNKYVLDGTSIKKPEEGEAVEEAGTETENWLDITDYVQYENWKKE